MGPTDEYNAQNVGETRKIELTDRNDAVDSKGLPLQATSQ